MKRGLPLSLSEYKRLLRKRAFAGVNIYNLGIMRDVIYQFIMWVARVHDSILGINDSGQYNLTDKQLHFWVIGLFGMALILLIQPVFKGLAENGHTLVITWIYVFTLVVVFVFAVEIGQWYSGTGVPDSADVAYGLSGFLVLFLIYAIVRATVLGIWKMIKGSKDREVYERYVADDTDRDFRQITLS